MDKKNSINRNIIEVRKFNINSDDYCNDDGISISVSIRLDKLLSKYNPDFSRSALSVLIKSGMVLIDDLQVSTASYKVKADCILELSIPEPIEAEPKAEKIDLDIVYEDDDLIIINKPVGMVVHQGAGNYSGTLVNALLYHCKDSLSGIGGVKRPGIVHRLDRDTSGLLMVAKNDFTHRDLSLQLSSHTVIRRYIAITYGFVTSNIDPNDIEASNIEYSKGGRIETNIGRNPYSRLKMAVVENGRKAITNYKILQHFGRYASLLECKLETGRTHQIRVHLTHIGYPLIGDKLYGRPSRIKMSNFPDTFIDDDTSLKKYIKSFPRQALHAKILGFVHPRTGKDMLFTQEIPNDMKELLDILADS